MRKWQFMFLTFLIIVSNLALSSACNNDQICNNGETLLNCRKDCFIFGINNPTPVNMDDKNFIWLTGNFTHIRSASMFDWEVIEKQKGQFDWSKTDNDINIMTSNGFKFIGAFNFNVPCWASKFPSDTECEKFAPRDLNDFSKIVKKAVARYPQIIYWEPPGELNGDWSWKQDKTFSYNTPEQTVEIQRVFYQAVKSANPNAKVLLSPPAFVGDYSGIKYIEDIYKAGGKNYFDIMAIHPYQFYEPPWQTNPSTGYNFKGGIERVKKTMNDYGDNQKTIWITEMGYPSQGTQNAPTYLPTENQQSDYLKSIYETVLSLNYVEAIFWYKNTDASEQEIVTVPFCLENARDCVFGLIKRDDWKRIPKKSFTEYVKIHNSFIAPFSCIVSSYEPALNTFCGSKNVIDNCGEATIKVGTLQCQSGQSCQNNVCIQNCTESNWQFTLSPEDCPSNNQQTKTWRKIGNCINGIQKPATENISCNHYITTCNAFTYSEWANCSISNVQTRTVTQSYPENCQGGNPTISQACNYALNCTEEDWKSIDGECNQSGMFMRTWNKTNSCSNGISHEQEEILICIQNNDSTSGNYTEDKFEIENQSSNISNFSEQSEDMGKLESKSTASQIIYYIFIAILIAISLFSIWKLMNIMRNK